MGERNSVNRFDDRVRDYVRARPGYPPEAFEAMIDGLGEPAALVAADIGAGTGISSRGLADQGPRVIAIEPGVEMRGAARAHPRVEFRDGAADRTGLSDSSVDLVLCAQSYHWFESETACLEFARILRPGGRLALVWNDGDEADPVAGGYYALIREVATESTASHEYVQKEPDVWGPFSPVRLTKLRHAQELDLEGLQARARSASYVPREGSGARRLVEDLRALHAEHAGPRGTVAMRYDVWLWLADRA